MPANSLPWSDQQTIGAGYMSGYARADGIDWAVSISSSFELSLTTLRQYSVRASPGILLIPPDGRIIQNSSN
jgi:hypothetical protein